MRLLVDHVVIDIVEDFLRLVNRLLLDYDDSIIRLFSILSVVGVFSHVFIGNQVVFIMPVLEEVIEVAIGLLLGIPIGGIGSISSI